MQKIGRLSRTCVISEKIDGTNASIFISEKVCDGGCDQRVSLDFRLHNVGCSYVESRFLTGSRTRWITPQDDNVGFSRWAHEHKEELMKLGPGHHFGEWWGIGIGRGYDIGEKRFSLFNATRWRRDSVRPACCKVVPILYEGIFSIDAIDKALRDLVCYGSQASPGFARPEGVVVYHAATKTLFKKTIEKDEVPKGQKD